MPTETDRLAMKWDGEWHITDEVFRDLGFAFAVVLVLIYVLVVAWFQSFGIAAGDHGADPADAGRHYAGARHDGRVLHRDIDDRLHRRRGNYRAEFDHPGGLHRTAPQAGHDRWRKPWSMPARSASGPCC